MSYISKHRVFAIIMAILIIFTGFYFSTTTQAAVKPTIDISASAITIQPNVSYRLRATTSNNSNVLWKSKNPFVATVNSNGTVTGRIPGTAVITATSGGTIATCKVTVKRPVVKLSRSTIVLSKNQSRRIVATTSNNQKPVWLSSNSKIATVDQNGTIHTHKKGTVIITASVIGAKSQCFITVR